MSSLIISIIGWRICLTFIYDLPSLMLFIIGFEYLYKIELYAFVVAKSKVSISYIIVLNKFS